MHCLSKRHTYTVHQALIKIYNLIIILTLKWFSAEGDYMWYSKEFIYFHYTIIQVVTSNQWTHSCNNLSLTDSDLLYNDVVVNLLPQGKVLNIDWSYKGGGFPSGYEKSGTFELLFLRITWNHIKHIPTCTTSTISEKHTSTETLDTCTSSIFRILFQRRKTRFSLVFHWYSREESLHSFEEVTDISKTSIKLKTIIIIIIIIINDGSSIYFIVCNHVPINGNILICQFNHKIISHQNKKWNKLFTWHEH